MEMALCSEAHCHAGTGFPLKGGNATTYKYILGYSQFWVKTLTYNQTCIQLAANANSERLTVL